MTATRRLAAILAADVAGYSRLIGADKEGTLNRLRSIRAELIGPKITENRGRLVKTTGDGLLVEFASVVDASRCATGWQAGMAERNVALSPTIRIEFRIGVHQGDIVVENEDIFGDGVNVAARLEALAEPGGILFRPVFRKTRRADSTSPSTIWASRPSRTSRGKSGSTGFASTRLRPHQKPR